MCILWRRSVVVFHLLVHMAAIFCFEVSYHPSHGFVFLRNCSHREGNFSLIKFLHWSKIRETSGDWEAAIFIKEKKSLEIGTAALCDWESIHPCSHTIPGQCRDREYCPRILLPAIACFVLRSPKGEIQVCSLFLVLASVLRPSYPLPAEITLRFFLNMVQ